MTMPFERYRAVNSTADFLKELATDRDKYPRVPKHVRDQAFALLRHYPTEWEMDQVSKQAPDWFNQKF